MWSRLGALCYRHDSRAICGSQISIRQRDRLIFVNDTAFDILTHGNPNEAWTCV